MSIDTQIRQALASGKLSYLPREMRDKLSERAVLFHPSLVHKLTSYGCCDEEEDRFGNLQLDLEHFVEGGVISMGFTPHQHRDAYIGRLCPTSDGTWEIRSRAPSPGLRVFGRFAKKDVFIAFDYEFRSVKPFWGDKNKKPLGDNNNYEYEVALLNTMQMWDEIFSGTEPIKGDNWREYITRGVPLVRD